MTDSNPLGLAAGPDPAALARTFEEPDWLLDDRLAADALARELPGESNPLFTSYHDLRPVHFGEIRPYADTGDSRRLSTRLPAGASAFLHVRDDTVVARSLSAAAESGGVIVDTFANVLRRDGDLLRRFLDGRRTLGGDDRIAQVTRAGFALGVLVHVPAGVELAEPIVLRWSQGHPGRGLLSRTVIWLEKNAHASVLEEQVRSAPADSLQSLWAGTTEVLLGPGASLDVAGEEDFGPKTASFVSRHATLDEDASLRWSLATVGGAFVKSRIDNVLAGRGASVRQAEIGFGSGTQVFDLTSYTRHVGRDTTGDLLSKGVFRDASRGFFKGLIEIEKPATGTDSFLGEFAMLLTKKARSVAIPSLEIDQPDVRRASHSSSVGPIDESQVFYLMSRGLPRDVARKFIVLGFLEPVVARIPLEPARERLRELLDQKWRTAG